MEKIDVVKHILRHVNHGSFINSGGGFAWAHSNVALCKYWGKRDVGLNLPATSSLSVALGNKGAAASIKQEGDTDCYVLNGNIIDDTSRFAKRLKKFLDLFRPRNSSYFIEININIPIAAGFASSACGFASIVQALDKLYDWRLDKKDLSILARLGSGSASRSLYDGFVEWQMGADCNGMDSFSIKLEQIWPQLRLGMLVISTQEKPLSSTEAMQHTLSTSALYSGWPKRVAEDLVKIKHAITHKDFIMLGATAEANAIAMHATMRGANPSIDYSLPDTIRAIAKINEVRASGLPVFFTQDAGPNLQLLFTKENEMEVLRYFPGVEVIAPFCNLDSEQLVLVNDNDVEIGTCDKMAAHVQGKLHRAFSVAILRKRGDKVEMLMQQRSFNKYHSAGLWSNTCCGHPRSGEDIIKAAERRLYEEMGFSVPLKEVGKFHYVAKFNDIGLIENEIDHVLVGFYGLEEFNFNTQEIQSCKWVEIEQLLCLQANPTVYTAWLHKVFGVVLEHYQNHEFSGDAIC